MGVPAVTKKIPPLFWLMVALAFVCVMPSSKPPVDAQAVISNPNPDPVLWSGHGVPPGATGDSGDFWINQDAPMAIYGPKAAPATWPGPFSLVGATGSNGSNGSAATIGVGTVSPLSAGASPTIVNGGSSSAASFNFGIPAGATGSTGSAGAAGVNAFSAPNTRTVAFATAYQATDNTKPAMVGVEIECVVTVALGSPTANTVELIIGSTNAVAAGTGTKVDTMKSDLSVSILLSLGFTNRQFLQASLPAGYYFAARRTSGTACTVQSAFDQSVG